MNRQTSPIRYTRHTARGYKMPSIVCFDCDRATASYQTVGRDYYGDGRRQPALVCRMGTGCHRVTDPHQQPPKGA